MKVFYLCFFLGFYYSSFSQIQVSTLVADIDASGGVKVDSEGNIIVADFGESLDNSNGTNVWKVTPEGMVSLLASGLSGASGNDFDSEGNLFQSNIGAGIVSKIIPNGTVSTFASDMISCNVGIAIDPEDNLYVCNCCAIFGNSIKKISPEGIVTPFSAGNLFNCPNGITIDNNNNLYVSNFGNGNIIKITPTGFASLFGQTPGTTTSAPSNGHIVYSPQQDVLYVASHGSHRIYRLDMNGNLEVLAGTTIRGNQDGPALEATFSRPNGLALSITGDTLYVNSSIPTTDAGGRPLNPSKLRQITGLLGIASTKGEITENFSLHISPNPSTGNIQIKFEEAIPSPISIKLLDTTGKKIKGLYQDQIISANQSINCSFDHLPKGIYYLQFEDSKRSFLRKVIFQ